MDLKIIIFCFVLLYNKGFCLIYEVVNPAVYQYYTVTTDQQHTDQETFLYTENIHKSMKERIKERLQFVRHKWVCKTQPEIKAIICEDLLQVHVNGFTFELSVTSLKCIKKSYTIQLLTLAKSIVNKLTIFDCPPVSYIDLETGKQITLPYTYKISKARTYNSAILFVQKDADSNDLYPQKYVRNINFKRMNTSAETLGSQPAESELAKSEHDGITDDVTKTYLPKKHENSPYDKFERFFSSINVCGLRRAPKIHLCKQSLRAALKYRVVEFDLLRQYEPNCRKYRVGRRKPDGRIENNPTSKELYLIRCPPITEQLIQQKPQFIRVYYIASNLSYQSITLFARDDVTEIPQQERDIHGLNMGPILEHNRRERFLPITFTKKFKNIRLLRSYQEVEDAVNSLGADVPSTSKKSVTPIETPNSKIGNTFQFTTNRWLTDHVLIFFSKVKMTKLIYTRFMITHKSIDICRLTTAQRTLLCNSALEDVRLQEEENLFTSDLLPTCSRRKVTLTALEADDYETNQFLMSGCHSRELRLQDLYFVGKNHLKDSAIIYKKVMLGKKAYYYPYTLITKIDRNKLIKTVRIHASHTPKQN